VVDQPLAPFGRSLALGSLEKALGHNFAQQALLEEALTHRSFGQPHNERLEFLGDSVLGFVVSDILYRRFPTAREGELTHLRTMIVRRETLANLATGLDLGSLLLLGVGEEEGGGRSRPATLCACLEALIGALYLDQGLEKVVTFLRPAVETLLAPLQLPTMPKDPKSRLQEWAQHALNVTPRYRVVEQTGPDHLRTFTTVVLLKTEIVGVGKGNSKQEASQTAAASALHHLGLEAPEYLPDPALEALYRTPPPSTADTTLDAMPEATPEATPDATPETTPTPSADAAAEPATAEHPAAAGS